MTHSNPYRAMMDYLDNLVKSRFIEMFNSFSPSKKVKEVCSFLSRGKSAHYCEDSEYYIIGQACIRTNCIEFDRVRCMDPTKYVPKFELRYGDVLINSTGVGSLGRCNKFYNPDGRTYVTDSHVTILRLNLEMINPDYIRHYINLDKVQAEIYAKCVNGSTNQIELNKGDFSNFMIPLPPISLQNKFSDFVKQVDKSKVAITGL